jgi:hypothetical protein
MRPRLELDPNDDFKSAHAIRSIRKDKYGFGMTKITLMRLALASDVRIMTHTINMTTYSFEDLLKVLRKEHKIKDQPSGLRRPPDGPKRCDVADVTATAEAK